MIDETFLQKKNFAKIFGSNNFPSNFLFLKILGPHKLDPKNFRLKDFGLKANYGQKNFVSKNSLGNKKILGGKEFW